MKTLTISIAAYNVEEYIEEALNSLLDPEIIDDLEVIVVNDGSKDYTSKIAHKYSSKYPDSIKVIDKENGGYGSTINTSLPLASGKYFRLLDGDDWYNRDVLKEYINCLKSSESDLIITPVVTVVNETGEKKVINPLSNLSHGTKLSFSNYPEEKLLSMPMTCFKTMAIKGKNNRIREHCFYTDTEFILKNMSYCKTIEYYNLPVYLYRIGLDEQSMSLQGMRKHYKDAITYYTEMIRFRKEENINRDYYNHYLTEALASLGKYHLNMFFILPANKKKEYVEFEQFLKSEAPDIHERSITKKNRLLCKTNYLLYRPACWWGKWKVRKSIRV